MHIPIRKPPAVDIFMYATVQFQDEEAFELCNDCIYDQRLIRMCEAYVQSKLGPAFYVSDVIACVRKIDTLNADIVY